MKKLIIISGIIFIAVCIAFFFLFLNSPSHRDQDDPGYLAVLTWDNLFDPVTLVNFTKETGIKVKIIEYESMEDCLAMVQAAPDLYDIIISENYIVSTLTNLSLLQPFDPSLIPNLANYDPAYVKKVSFSALPFLFGSMGLAINTGYVSPDRITGWKSLWDPEYKGKIALLNDLRAVTSILFLAADYPPNATAHQATAAAYTEAEQLKKNEVTLGTSMSNLDLLTSGEKWVVQAYSGDTFKKIKTGNPSLTFINPGANHLFNGDYFMLGASAVHRDQAHSFVNYFLRPDVAAVQVRTTFYCAPVLGIRKYLSPDFFSSLPVCPSPEEMVGGLFFTDVETAAGIYQRIFNVLKRP